MRYGSHDITICDVLPYTYGDAIIELILRVKSRSADIRPKIKIATLQIEMAAAVEAMATI